MDQESTAENVNDRLNQPVAVDAAEIPTTDPAAVEAIDVPFGLGIAVGKPGPFPYRLRLPTAKGPKVATFWQHPSSWRHSIASSRTASLIENWAGKIYIGRMVRNGRI